MKNQDWKNLFPKENRYFETENGILYCGDCFEFLPKFPPESVDLVITDPPYGVGSGDVLGLYDYKDEFYDVDTTSKELYRILKKNTRCFVFTAQKTYIDVVQAFTKAGFELHQTLIWYRPNLAGGTRKKTYDFTSVYEQILNLHKGNPPKIRKDKNLNHMDVLKYAQPQGNFKKDKRYHIHQKPLDLIRHLIIASTCENEIILGPFAGSGTTAVASEILNRRWVCIEINEDYCNVTKNRLLEVKYG